MSYRAAWGAESPGPSQPGSSAGLQSCPGSRIVRRVGTGDWTKAGWLPVKGEDGSCVWRLYYVDILGQCIAIARNCISSPRSQELGLCWMNVTLTYLHKK